MVEATTPNGGIGAQLTLSLLSRLLLILLMLSATFFNKYQVEKYENNSERPVDALAEKHESLTDSQLEIKRC